VHQSFRDTFILAYSAKIYCLFIIIIIVIIVILVPRLDLKAVLMLLKESQSSSFMFAKCFYMIFNLVGLFKSKTFQSNYF